jgi:hypothetical protein
MSPVDIAVPAGSLNNNELKKELASAERTVCRTPPLDVAAHQDSIRFGTAFPRHSSVYGIFMHGVNEALGQAA